MKHPLIIPALADLRQDIAGSIPVGLIKSWIESDRTAETHGRLLAPYAKRGTLVKSDSAGLSKLSRARPLIEVLKLVSEPKGIIAAHGSALGGIPVGIWIADDTEMFYPDSIHPETILQAMIAAQQANQKNTVHIGLGLHRGMFYEVGEGMYGDDADFVEELAENHTEGGEIALTPAFSDALPSSYAPLLTKKTLEGFESRAFTLAYDGLQTSPQTIDPIAYPAPFSKNFLHELENYTEDRADEISDRYARDGVVVLVRIFHEHQPLLLNQLSEFVAASSEMTRIAAHYDITKIKVNGQLGIYHTDSNDEAMHFAVAMRDELSPLGWDLNVALVRGSSFLFPMENGGMEIAGSTVNLASKIAEDTDERNHVYIETSAAAGLTHPASAQPFSVTRSGVTLSGIRV